MLTQCPGFKTTQSSSRRRCLSSVFYPHPPLFYDYSAFGVRDIETGKGTGSLVIQQRTGCFARIEINPDNTITPRQMNVCRGVIVFRVGIICRTFFSLANVYPTIRRGQNGQGSLPCSTRL